ncbi:NAD-dependent epimerase/dehydratase family protein, partial [bacterium 1XD8-76]
MRILVTGSNGFVGRNLVWNLKELRDGKNGTRPDLTITEIYGYDTVSTKEDLDRACSRCDFVFHLAGVNRPKEKAEFMEGNYGAASLLLDTLKAHQNACPVMLASSVQASLSGRFQDSDYGKSKLAGEELFFRYGEETGAKVLVYRFPNLFGKWCRPRYNSAVATFCHAVANGLEYTVDDPGTELELLYIDDLIEEMLDALEGKEHRCEYPKDDRHDGLLAVEDLAGRYCYAP